MTKERIQRGTRRPMPWRLMLLCGGTLLLFGAASAPAHADSNFERGFERELGRILAHEAVNAGKAILFHGVVHPHATPVHYGHRDRHYRDRRHRDDHRPYRVYRTHHRDHRYGYWDDHRKHKKHWKKHKREHRKERRKHRRHRDHHDCRDHY